MGSIEGSGTGIVLIFLEGDKLQYTLHITFTPYTNNIVEYKALLHGTRIAKEMTINRLECFGDSNLVSRQVSSTCDAVDPDMISYRRAVDRLGGYFAGHSVQWIDRRKKEEADALT
jgi:ribonuclease HI